MTQINAYFTFKDNCREAMTFYQDCFGGDLNIQTVEGSPMQQHLPPSAASQILHASLTSEKLVLMASEMGFDQVAAQGSNISLCINCSGENESRILFSKLSDGGTITCELADSFWGGLFGAVTDRFGTRWLVNTEKKNPA